MTRPFPPVAIQMALLGSAGLAGLAVLAFLAVLGWTRYGEAIYLRLAEGAWVNCF